MEIPVFLYDIGLTAKEATWLREQYLWAELRRFKFDAHPDYFDVNIAMGEYAWKPVIIKEMLDTVANKVLWLDSGDRLTRPSDLQYTFDRIEQSGFVTTQTSGTTQKWVHPGMHAYLHSESMVQRTMCNGAIIGFDRTHSDMGLLCTPARLYCTARLQQTKPSTRPSRLDGHTLPKRPRRTRRHVFSDKDRKQHSTFKLIKRARRPGSSL